MAERTAGDEYATIKRRLDKLKGQELILDGQKLILDGQKIIFDAIEAIEERQMRIEALLLTLTEPRCLN
jgi:hypothetical protein